ncbi:sensor histidine kinase [Spongiimicrobium salis]|uniref:sensor histidine kinase n=1 Tax=Spongiimicrobium salis TaxID=1667022 RepID=UPI00374D7CF1
MSKLDNWVDNKVIQNLFIWCCLFFILLGVIQAENKVIPSAFIIVLLAPAIYINNILILPFFNRNKWRFLVLFAINASIFTVVAVFLLLWAIDQEYRWTMFLNLFGILILALTFGSALKISRDSFVRRQEEKNAELKLLKAQLNPHFLFNTLNNLYGLSVIKSDKLPGLMLKLSDLLRYSLYDTKETYVSLEREIQYLENYIALEKIRLEDQAEIHVNITGAIAGNTIAPMLLIVFVENAFKHLAMGHNQESRVEVILDITGSSLSFSCTNAVDTKLNETDMEAGKSGIGLQNAKKRLVLLYPEKHQLTIVKKNDTYTVQLILDL